MSRRAGAVRVLRTAMAAAVLGLGFAFGVVQPAQAAAQDVFDGYDVQATLNPDGTVGGLQLQTLGGNSYTRAAAEAASRAIYQCQPYRLPADRYNLWREISPLRFDPRQMMEQ